MRLYAFPPSPRSFKVMLAADHLGLDYELRVVHLLKGEQNAPEIAALNPNRRMPVLWDDGYVLWESNAILQYLASKRPEAGLLPEETRARLLVERWLFWESAHWDPACAIFAFERMLKPMLGRGETSAAEIERATGLLERCAEVLERQLAAQRCVAGDHLTVADLAIGAALVIAERARYPLEPYAAIRRWQGELAALPGWRQAAAARERVPFPA
ncbi:MAG: glutathione S-transferase family protein [Stellaceae bacterium]